MRVAFVNQPWNKSVPPVQSGSIAMWTYEVARRLAQFCEVVVYAKSQPNQKKTIRHQGVLYRYIPIIPDKWLFRFLKHTRRFRGGKQPLFASPLYYLGYILQAANNIRHQQCDIIHLHNFSQFVPVVRAFNPHAKIVLHMHCEWLTQLERSMIAHRLKNVDLVIGCSEYITAKIRMGFPQFAKHCQTIFNGVDIELFPSQNDQGSSLVNTTKRLLFVGRITPEKGLHILLDAFQQIVGDDLQVTLDIIGPEARTSAEFIIHLSHDQKLTSLASFYRESYLAYLQRQLAPNLADRVTFLGFIPHASLSTHYRRADVFVNPSLSDAFPMTVPEAMATGLPVVATRVGGVSEIVGHEKTGLLVEPGDAGGLAAAILRLLADHDLRRMMGKAARERINELFSWEQIVKNLRLQYQEIYHGYE
jgi:glycosyltransferase involved in cell wall biosynthesis